MFRDQLQMQQRREVEKLKEKASMAPTASPSIQEGKSEFSIQGKHSKLNLEWKNQSKAESEQELEKAEREVKKSEVVSGKERERKEKKKNNFYLSLSVDKKAFLNDKQLLVIINKDAYLKIFLLYRTLSTLLRSLLSGNLKI